MTRLHRYLMRFSHILHYTAWSGLSGVTLVRFSLLSYLLLPFTQFRLIFGFLPLPSHLLCSVQFSSM